jgi:hypothetical protein
MTRKLIPVAAALLMLSTTGAKADEISELKKQLTQQQLIIEQLARRIEQLESRQDRQETVIEEKVSSAVEQKQIQALPDSIKWVENVKVGGDLRYRHESIDSESSKSWSKGRHRHRIRARLGIDAKVADDWDVGFRIASGSGDPVSTNQTLDNSFSSKALWLDLAYFNWHPSGMKGMNVYGGKMKNPFYRAGKNQLIWDSDLNPEGIAAKFQKPLNDATDLFINGGGFWVDERSGGVDTSLWGAQAYFKHKLGNPDYILAGAGYYDYGNIEGRGNLASTWGGTASFFGNSVDANGNFMNDYDVVEGFAEYGFELGALPVAIFGNYAQNTSAVTNEDTAWLAGFTLNKAKKPGSWQATYMFRDVEADAVLGAFTDSDFIGGGTDGQGHTFGFKYQLAKNLQAALTYFLSERDSTDDDYNRLQGDLILKF